MNVPPRPTTPPRVEPSFLGGQREHAEHYGSRGQQAKNIKNMNTTKNGGFNVHVHEKSGSGNTAGQKATVAHGKGGSVPGADFSSNDDIRAFCEHHRKKCRNGATELAMDADHLEAVLKTIPDLGGSLGGSRARARRVSRWLKKAAAAEKNKQKYFAALFGTFEREYDSELRTIGKGRLQQKSNKPFGWR